MIKTKPKVFATRNGRPAHELRPRGYVTATMFREHGGFVQALAVLNGGRHD